MIALPRHRRRRARAAAVMLAPMVVALAAGALSGCHKSVASAAPTQTGLSQTGAQTRDPLSVSVTPVQVRSLKGGLAASGLLTPKLEAAVTTELNGYRVAQVFVDQGARVTAGQPLVRLDDTLLKTQIAQQQASVAQQQVMAERAEAEAQRVAGLDNQGVLPEEQIVERRLAVRSARAVVNAAQAQLNDLTTREGLMTVRAPVSGLVLERMVRPGDIATPSTAMFRIAADDVIELNAEVPESALAGIRPGDPAQVSLPSGATVDGVVRLVSPEVDQQTKLGHVRVTLPARPDLRPGGFGQASFSAGSRAVAVVPESAIRFDADGAAVMVLQSGNRVKRVPVHTGTRAQGMVELLDGPPAGSRVLLGGGAFVLDGDTVRPVDVSAEQAAR